MAYGAKARIQEEIEKLQKDLDSSQRNIQLKMEQEIKNAQEDTRREIENESVYLRNLLDIDIAKLRAEVDKDIEKLNAERYKDLGVSGSVNSDNPEIDSRDNAAYKQKAEKEIDTEKEAFEAECQQRRARFEAQIKLINTMAYFRDDKLIEFLKKEIVPLVTANGVSSIADEATLDRYRIKITRNALRTGPSWALYKARYQDSSAVCRVTVLSKVPIEIRRQLNSSAKCMRFLCEKPMHTSFPKLFDIFGTDQKMYYIMNEYEPISLQYKIYRLHPSSTEIRKWTQQLAEAFHFMHRYAIAHLNIKSENIIFDKAANIIVVGLSRAFLYFNLDQETIIKAPQIERTIYNEHLPPECFVGDFPPQPADIWSFGVLIYEMMTKSNPTSSVQRANNNKRSSNSKNSDKLPSEFRFEKITDQTLRSLLEKMLNLVVFIRPKWPEILHFDYFMANTDPAVIPPSTGNATSTAENRLQVPEKQGPEKQKEQ